MSEDSNKGPKKDMDVARKIWLAGVGAYGRAIGDAQDAYAKMGKETARVFDELVGKGEELESKVSTVAKNYVPEMAKKHSDNVKATVEDRMERMKAALGFAEASADQHEQLAGVEARLSAIERKVDQILVAMKPTKSAPKSASKPAAKSVPKSAPKSAVKRRVSKAAPVKSS